MKGSQFILVLVFISILVFPGCKKYKVPYGFPDVDEMAQIIAELHMVESSMNYGASYTYTPERNNPGYYRSILEKHGLTSEKFDTIRKWYVDNPVIYQYVYDRVIVILSKREAEIRISIEREKAQEQQKQEEMRKRPSNLWHGETSYVVGITDTIDKRLPFRFLTDTLLIEGSLKLTAFYKFLREDISRSPQMMLSVLYNDSTADTVYQEIPHSFHNKGAILSIDLKKNVKAIEIFGYLLLQDSLFSASVEVENISLMVVNDSLREPEIRGALRLEKTLE